MSDNEIDAELLALAEGDSSEEEGEYDATQHIEERSPTPDVKPSVEKIEDSGVRRGVAQKVRAKRGRRARRKDDSDEDDDEAFASSPDSFLEETRRSDSADAPGSPMSNEEEAPLYPIEGKYMSTSDRDWLTSLPELEREQELDRRAQEVIRRQQDLQLKRALASNKAATKRKADDAELEEASRKSTRPKVERGAKSALDKYKKAREQAGAERERRDGRRDTRRDERSPSEDSQRDADGESEVEWAEPDRRRDEPGPEVADFNRCRVGRSNFAQICFFPGFEEAITGCYVRLSVGPNRETGENIYRMALVKGFRESKPYHLDGANGKKIFTDQYVVLAQGKSERHWPFAACSDGKFTPAELGRYLETLKEQRLRMPTVKVLNAKVNDINNLLSRRWTDDDISAKIAKQKGIQQKYDPANVAKLAREKLQKRKEIAEAEDDFDEIAKCNAELLALESNGTTPRVPIAKKSAALSEHERLAALNEQNREANRREVRMAQLRERARDLAADQRRAAAKKAAEEAKLKVPDELFGEASDISRSATPNGHKKKANGTPLKVPLGALRSGHKNDDDVIGAMDLDIDIEI